MKKLFLLPLMLMLAVVAQGQSFIGCRVDGGWAETPKLRKTFTVKKNELKRYDFQTLTFHISVTSLGYHEVYINGVKVGDRVLQPAVSQLDKRALEVSYDITDLVREGENEGIEDINADGVNIYVKDGRIVVDGTTEEYRIYDITGRIVAHSHSAEIASPLSCGVYLVKVGLRPARKVVVR